jgi:hypothetical protein
VFDRPNRIPLQNLAEARWRWHGEVYLEHAETAGKRFIWETRSAAAMDHPFICKVYEVGETGPENKSREQTIPLSKTFPSTVLLQSNTKVPCASLLCILISALRAMTLPGITRHMAALDVELLKRVSLHNCFLYSRFCT